MDIYEIRKKNLVSLIGNRRKGACAQRWEMAPAHLSQILSDRTEKNLGDDVARRIERIENLPHGWMDCLHDRTDTEQASSSTDNPKEAAAAAVMDMLQKHRKGLSAAAQQKIADAVADSLAESAPIPGQQNNVIIADFLPPAPAGDAIRVAHYDVRSALGSGQQVPDYPEIMPDLVVSKQHLQELGVIYKDPAHLKMLTGYGQSMAPTIQHLDPMIVDVSIREFEGDGIYSFVWQGHFYTKRLQVADAEHFEMISDNPNHKDRMIRIDDTYIQARVLLVWNAKKL